LLNWASKNFSSGDRTREVVERAYGFCYEIGKKKSLTKHFHLYRMVVKEEFLNCGNLCINHGVLDVGRRVRGVAMSLKGVHIL
jgi:hypothetical protein